jgi:hypothetical protein
VDVKPAQAKIQNPEIEFETLQTFQDLSCYQASTCCVIVAVIFGVLQLFAVTQHVSIK